MIRVHISELTSSCLTRMRGRLAFEALQKRTSTVFDIDLNDVEPISSSFLDEFVTRLNADTRINVTFLTHDRQVVSKLAQISSLRNVPIYYRAQSIRKRVPPRSAIFSAFENVDGPPVELAS